MKWFAGLLLLVLAVSHSYAQQGPFALSRTFEPIWLESGIILGTAGLAARSFSDPLSNTELAGLDASKVNSFDRFATEIWSPKAADLSDYLLFGSFGLNAAMGLKSDMWRDKWTLGVIYIESFGIAYGLTDVTKTAVQRIRPLAYNPNVPLEEKLKRTGRLSFFSGHTSLTAVNCVFGAAVLSAYTDNPTWKKVIWAGGLLYPATVAYLRVAAGKHYPTDVIAGYAVGAAVGYFVPYLHRRNRTKKPTVQWMPSGGRDWLGMRLAINLER